MLNSLSHALGFAGEGVPRLLPLATFVFFAGLAFGVGALCLRGDCDAFLDVAAEAEADAISLLFTWCWCESRLDWELRAEERSSCSRAGSPLVEPAW